MNKSNIRLRLILMNFLEFAVWGAYLTAMCSFLTNAGFGDKVWLFYATQGIVSIFMPALMGIVADKWLPAQKVLSLCHAFAGIFMFAAAFYAMEAGPMIAEAFNFKGNPAGPEGYYLTHTPAIGFVTLYVLYTISTAFFMPTIAISNSVAYNALDKAGMDSVKEFPPIRVFGTVGFILTMLVVNFLKGSDGLQFQHTYNQFFVSGGLSLVLCAYALTLPNCPTREKNAGSQSFLEATGLSAFKLFNKGQFAIFFIFSMLLGASLQITNGYANIYITSFQKVAEFEHTWGAQNANALISLSQISEALCILLIPFCMKKFGIKKVMLIAMFAWVFRFGFFGLGNPGGGVWLFVLSCIVYGVAFDFFNVSGSLYVDQNVDSSMRSSAQGLFMLMTNGLGASIGTWAAGRVVNYFVFNAAERQADPSWSTAWYIFAAYALVVGVLFMILFKDPQKVKKA